MTYVIDGGGWNLLDAFPDDWPNLRALMGESANFRNAIVGSFPAVTACAHGTIGTGAFPSTHGVTGHNIRDEHGTVRKAYDSPGKARPGDIWIPTLSDLWHDQTNAWVGQIGYQVWHLGTIGYGGRNRPADDLPVGVFWDEDGTRHLAAPQPRAVPASGVDAGARGLPALPRRVRRPGLGRPVHPGRAPVSVLPPADRAVSRRRDRGGVRLRADR